MVLESVGFANQSIVFPKDADGFLLAASRSVADEASKRVAPALVSTSRVRVLKEAVEDMG
jgi:hypothetical protein